jgi:hypothetical protein
MFVAVQVSSMNTSRAGSRSGCVSNHASRCFRRSGRILLNRMAGLLGWPAPHRRHILVAAEKERTMTQTKIVIAVLGVDLGKNSCILAGLDATGAVVLRRRMTRDGLIKFIAGLPPALWRWRPAAAPTLSGARQPSMDTKSD